LAAIAAAQCPGRLVPARGLVAGDVLGEVHALQPRPVAGLPEGRLDVDGAVGGVDEGAVGGAAVADAPGQAAGVDAGQRPQVVAAQPVVEVPGGTPVGGLGDGGAQDAAAGRRGDGLDVLGFYLKLLFL
jgi:hypothetical protein